jgi:hypothetical protein
MAAADIPVLIAQTRFRRHSGGMQAPAAVFNRLQKDN